MGDSPSYMYIPLVQGRGIRVLGGRHSFLHSTCSGERVEGFGWETLLPTCTFHLSRGEG